MFLCPGDFADFLSPVFHGNTAYLLSAQHSSPHTSSRRGTREKRLASIKENFPSKVYSSLPRYTTLHTKPPCIQVLYPHPLS